MAIVVPQQADDAVSVSYPVKHAKDGQEKTLRVMREAIITKEDIVRALPQYDHKGRPILAITLTEAGAQKMRAATAKHRGDRMAMIAEGEIITAPIIQGEFGGSFEISGGKMTREETEQIAAAINGNRSSATSNNKQS